ncbi:MAG: site-specific integrase [Roseburia sp.]|nr:site-specific integrase [Roseburia sp.]
MKDKVMEDYRDFLVSKDKSKSTISTYVRQVRRFMGECGEYPEDRSVVEDYVATLRKRYKPATVNLYAIAINSYLKWSGNEDLRIRTKKLKKMFVLENVISDEDYRRMLAYAQESGREKYYYIMRVLAGTGIRIGELRYITVENVKRGRGLVYNKGKYREIFISTGLQHLLMEYCRQGNIQTGAIFTGTTGNVLSRSAVWQMLVKIADRAGVDREKAHPHSFRHFFAKTYIDKCGDLTALANILGHNSLETTRIYTMRTGEEIREQMDGLGL